MIIDTILGYSFLFFSLIIVCLIEFASLTDYEVRYWYLVLILIFLLSLMMFLSAKLDLIYRRLQEK